MRGQFRLFLPKGKEIILPNTVTQEGEDAFLKMIFQNNDTIIAGGGNFYMGLCNQIPDQVDTMASITTEPTIGTGGYARQPITRDAPGWPTIDVVNTRKRITSAQFTFTASAADFDADFTRVFMNTDLTGFAGTLFSYSAALDSAILLLDGQSIDLQYEFFAD